MKKKIISIFLSLSLLCGMFFAMPTTASAASEENVEKVMGFLETTIEPLLDKSTIYTNATATQVAKLLYVNVIKTKPASVGEFFFEDFENNPLQPYSKDKDWSNVPDSIDWGVKAGDKDSFYKVITKLLRSFGSLLATVGPDGKWQEGDPAGNLMGYPYPMYRFGFHEFFVNLELKDVMTCAQFNDATAKLTANTRGAKSKFTSAYNQYVKAKEAGDQEKMDEYRLILEENGPVCTEYFDEYTNLFFNPIYDLVESLLNDPLTTLLEKLPLIDKSIRNGDIDWIIKMILPDTELTSFSIVDLGNAILGGIYVGEKPLGLTLTPKDMSAWAGQSKSQAFESLVTYVCEVLRNETDGKNDPSNLNAVKDLLAGMDLGDMQNLVDSVLDSVYFAPNAAAAASNLINTLAMAAPTDPEPTDPTDPTEPTEPVNPTDPSKPSEDTTKPTEKPSTTEPGTSTPDGSDVENPGNPQTGDVALQVFAVLSISAAAAYVIVRKKKD